MKHLFTCKTAHSGNWRLDVLVYTLNYSGKNRSIRNRENLQNLIIESVHINIGGAGTSSTSVAPSRCLASCMHSRSHIRSLGAPFLRVNCSESPSPSQVSFHAPRRWMESMTTLTTPHWPKGYSGLCQNPIFLKDQRIWKKFLQKLMKTCSIIWQWSPSFPKHGTPKK